MVQVTEIALCVLAGLLGLRLSLHLKLPEVQKLVIRLAPTGLRSFTYILGPYTFVLFVIFMVAKWRTHDFGPDEVWELRVSSALGMALSHGSLIVFLAARRILRGDLPQFCPKGHPVRPLARFCDECGDRLFTSSGRLGGA
jgi:hypothetical protein